MRDSEDDDFRGTGEMLPDGFVNEEAIAGALAMERQTHPDETHEMLTFRLFKENAAQVAMQMVNIALRGSSERLRLDAGKYVIDRVLGPMGKETHRADSPLDQMVRQMQADAEEAANQAYNQ
jgi:hypothetical protein